MIEKIKWYVVFISICIGIAGAYCSIEYSSLKNEISNLNRQIEQKDILIEFLKIEKGE